MSQLKGTSFRHERTTPCGSTSRSTYDALPQPHDAELGRILRYWAGNLGHYDLTTEKSESIRDSAYEEVGSWRVTA